MSLSDGLTANGKTISPHFFGKRGDNKGETYFVKKSNFFCSFQIYRILFNCKVTIQDTSFAMETSWLPRKHCNHCHGDDKFTSITWKMWTFLVSRVQGRFQNRIQNNLHLLGNINIRTTKWSWLNTLPQHLRETKKTSIAVLRFMVMSISPTHLGRFRIPVLDNTRVDPTRERRSRTSRTETRTHSRTQVFTPHLLEGWFSSVVKNEDLKTPLQFWTIVLLHAL
jgi:hypothetical protein